MLYLRMAMDRVNPYSIGVWASEGPPWVTCKRSITANGPGPSDQGIPCKVQSEIIHLTGFNWKSDCLFFIWTNLIHEEKNSEKPDSITFLGDLVQISWSWTQWHIWTASPPAVINILKWIRHILWLIYVTQTNHESEGISIITQDTTIVSTAVHLIRFDIKRWWLY